METDSVKVSWEQSEGITSIIDKLKDKELVFGDFGAFSPIYEVTPISDTRDIHSVRSKMGRNRKGFNVERSVGKLVDVKSFTDGELWLEAELEYQCKGMQFYRVNLKLWKEIQRLEVKVILHKDSVWEPENLYIAMPFTTGKNEQLFIDKPGCILKPMVEQIPGTLTDFYTVQSGFRLQNRDYGLSLGMPDTPILQLGPLEFGERVLCRDGLEPKQGYQFCRVMNNYWETNFNASLGGFYEFNYDLNLDSKKPTVAFEELKRSQMQTLALRLKN